MACRVLACFCICKSTVFITWYFGALLKLMRKSATLSYIGTSLVVINACMTLHNNNYLHYAFCRAQRPRCILRTCPRSPVTLTNLLYTLTLILTAKPRHTCSRCLRRMSSLQKLKKIHHISLGSSAHAINVKHLLVYREMYSIYTTNTL